MTHLWVQCPHFLDTCYSQCCLIWQSQCEVLYALQHKKHTACMRVCLHSPVQDACIHRQTCSCRYLFTKRPPPSPARVQELLPAHAQHHVCGSAQCRRGSTGVWFRSPSVSWFQVQCLMQTPRHVRSRQGFRVGQTRRVKGQQQSPAECAAHE